MNTSFGKRGIVTRHLVKVKQGGEKVKKKRGWGEAGYCQKIAW